MKIKSIVLCLSAFLYVSCVQCNKLESVESAQEALVIAEEAEQAGNQQESLQAYKKAWELDPSSGFDRLSNMYREREKRLRAVVGSPKNMKLISQNPEKNASKIVALQELKKLLVGKIALKEEQVSFLSSSLANDWYFLGQIYESLNSYKEAEVAYLKAYDLEKDADNDEKLSVILDAINELKKRK